MTSEAVLQIWRSVGAERDESARGFFEMSEDPAFESEAFLRVVDPLRRFLGCGFAAGHRRMSPEFYEVLLSRGQLAAEALLNAYMEDVDDTRATALPLWRAVSSIARTARSRGYDTGRLARSSGTRSRPTRKREALRAVQERVGRAVSNVVAIKPEENPENRGSA